jgi:hypothetical protein
MNLKQKAKQFSGADRRRYPRLKPSAIPLLRGAALHQGSEIQIIDISKGGMLLETEVRLRPQVKILLKLVTGRGIYKIAGQVLRSSITSLEGIPRYQSAVAFDHLFHELDDLKGAQDEKYPEKPPESKAATEFDDIDDPFLAGILPGNETNKSQAILTVMAHDGQGILLQESFELNDW